MTNKSKSTVIEWVCFGEFNITDESMTLEYLKQYISEKVPEGTLDEDIKLSFENDIRYGYYDECWTDGKMILSYKKAK